MSLTDYHQARNQRMKDRAERDCARRPPSVSEVMAQYHRLKRGGTRNPPTANGGKPDASPSAE